MVRVPTDAESIADAVTMVDAGGMVLVEPGIYRESVTVDKPDVTIRGADRNETVIDGEGRRPYGVVATAEGVRVENLTVTAHTFYGVLVTGLHDEDGPLAQESDGYEPFDPEEFPPLQRFSIDHVTAYNNGLYGIYAFNAQNGVIRDSYASGSPDAGFYVGQCRDCKILVEGNVAERNAIGFENSNASDSVIIMGNRFSGNRVGLTLNSDYQEAFIPQRGNTVVGNVISDNAEPDSPAHAEGGFGIGIGTAGGRENLFWVNRVEGNPVAGLVVRNTEDLGAVGNVVRGGVFGGNGIDVVNIAAERAPTRATCVDGAGLESVLPAGDRTDEPTGDVRDEHDDAGAADAARVGTSAQTVTWYEDGDCGSVDRDADVAPAQPAASAAELPSAAVPDGVDFLDVAAPVPQPTMSDVEEAPERLPDEVEMPSFADPQLPPEDLLADRTGTAPS
ncbi:right-handed parallel beta-helix repeat-containing protein [Phytoactinopolyspora halotolerans]|uniref:Plasmid stabilization protein n=1 Tax=Phytoactinopolyspora halotolerans TaxID=1981512 RepID=A0A6L9SD42_9ACTN|nr:right-handed parallel beta-helix repeat-containing protein [Phytoactinopolyspora halotolerans]NEE03285.1 plasmid stabilization protein [Phytoactinopolyspora halotolerans]